MTSATVRILNEKGLHARAAAAFVRSANAFAADVSVEKDGQEVSGHSILGLMMLGAACGTDITISCSGEQAGEALAALEKLVKDRFNED